MADNQIKFGKSAEEVALEMTNHILHALEKNAKVDRQTYLDTYVECLFATRFDRHTVKERKNPADRRE